MDIGEKVLVLMSTYNGQKYIETQIESILAQESVDVFLLVRDDGSTDKTRDILETYKKQGKLEWYTGENLGPAKSFMDLIMHVKSLEKFSYYAFCDQDDYWLPNKLSCAIECLKKLDANKPLLYYSSTILADANLDKLTNQTTVQVNSLTFKRALICSNATGCTMCFNEKLLVEAQRYQPEVLMMHDGWLHKLCLALDGQVYYDENSYIYYRQHGNNAVGGRISFRKKVKRRLKALTTDRQIRKKTIEQLLIGYGDSLSDENRKLCELYSEYDKRITYRLKLLFSKTEINNFRVSIAYKISLLLGVF